MHGAIASATHMLVAAPTHDSGVSTPKFFGAATPVTGAPNLEQPDWQQGAPDND